MSVKIMSAVFDKSKTEGNARLVLLALADCANDEGTCWPSISTISSMANINQQTTRKYLWAMESIGLITAEDRKDKIGRRTSNLYKINLEKLGEDFITKEVLRGQLYKSQIRTWDYDKEDTINRHIVPPSNPSHSGNTIRHHTGSYMKHNNEPTLEPPSPLTPKGEQASSGVPSHASDEFELIAQDLAADAEGSKSDDLDSRPPNTVKSTTSAVREKSPPRKARQPKLVDDAFIAQLAANNPRIDMDTELRKMNNWLLSHPNRQKTRAFVTNWINRVVDKLPEKEERFADF